MREYGRRFSHNLIDVVGCRCYIRTSGPPDTGIGNQYRKYTRGNAPKKTSGVAFLFFGKNISRKAAKEEKRMGRDVSRRGAGTLHQVPAVCTEAEQQSNDRLSQRATYTSHM